MDVMHADASMLFLPARDMATIAHAVGLPHNQMAAHYSEGLVGLPLAALPITALLRGDHVAVLHRDDEMSLLPGQPEVMALLGVETIGVLSSTARRFEEAHAWRFAASFTYAERIQPDLTSVTTVRKLLDADSHDLYSLAARSE